jgi:hypothetical protein
MSLFGDGLESVDLRNYNDLSLEEVGVHVNPHDENELYFLTDAGMGYGDIIRCAYYAKTIAKRYNKKCKIVFTILDETRSNQIARDGSDKIVFTAEEEIPKIAKVLSYYSKELKDVSHIVVPMSQDAFFEHAHPNIVNWLLPTRTLAVTQWLGQPYLKPDIGPGRGDHVAIWTTRKNLTPVAKWKNPVGTDAIMSIANNTELNVKHVSYRDDIEYVFETIRTAKFCIGYEGMGNLISQSYQKPCLVFSENEFHSKVTSGMWAEVSSSFSISHKYIQDKIRAQSEIIHRGTPTRKQTRLPNESLEFFKRVL